MFKWSNEYELGIKEIDKQHKKLFIIGNEMVKIYENNTDESSLDDILDVINELIDYTVYHFNTEEELLDKYNYDNLSEHKEKHEKFTLYLKSISYNELVQNEQKFLDETINLISNWIKEHIKREDMKYKKLIISKLK